MKKIVTSGKRKRAVARAIITEGSGNITVNKKNYGHLPFFDKLKIEEPLRLADGVLGKRNFDVSINVKGGGERGQIEAARLALARAILSFSKSKELEKVFSDYDWS
ncbi:MAG TPA: 30S ribosomal protein S9, partial [Candidatus Nanoarchaeia archaeon]|nr:30S ribosomal protein S9 [Candidatus Nanoarchaeia archaeon]